MPELCGYTSAEYDQLIKQDAANMTYHEDTEMVIANARKALAADTAANFEFRKQHRDGHIVWVNVYAKKIGEKDGYPLLQCVFHNISAFKQAQEELDHIINSIPGGIAAYDLTSLNRPHLILCSDGIAPLLGYDNRQELYEYCSDPWSTIFKDDYQRVRNAYDQMQQHGGAFNIAYRIIKKDGSLDWVHLDGKIVDGILYIVLAGMSEEAKLFQQIINETAHGIYVVDKNNYDLLYYNENMPLFLQDKTNVLGEKCYSALRGNKQPCDHCPLKQQQDSGKPLDFQRADGRSFEITTRPIQWNG